jgi:Fe-S cluster assembly iron-binding protein IscA
LGPDSSDSSDFFTHQKASFYQNTMIEVTDRAKQFLQGYLNDKPKSPIRIFVRLGGCGIRTFGVALEEPQKNDAVFEIDGYTFIINRKLLQKVQPIRVDSNGMGLRLMGTGIQTQSGCGNCGYICWITGGDRCTGDCDTCELKCDYGRRKNQAILKVPVKKEMQSDSK